MWRSILIPLVVAALCIGGFLACQSVDVPATQTGSLLINFDNVAGPQNLVLNSSTYQNSSGESFTVSKFNYFVSNIRLRRADGSDYVVPQDNSYFLIEEERPTSQTLTLGNVPTGSYTGISFVLGVDSLRSLADISLRTGVLDPGTTDHDAMYWDWNTGYIFLKLEGRSPAAPAAQNNQFLFHVGGFGGGYNGKKTINNLRTVSLTFGTDQLQVQTNSTPMLAVRTDALKLLDSPTPIRIAQHPAVMFEPFSATVASNAPGMFSYHRIQQQP